MRANITEREVSRSPLLEIERAVQGDAERLRLDPGDPVDRDRLGALIDDHIAEWNDDHRRGRRDRPIADPGGLAGRARRNLLGYGPLTPLLDDPDVWEIMVNAPDQIFVKRHRGPSGYHHEIFHDDDHVARTITKLLDDNSVSHRKLDPAEGLQDAHLDDGSRLHLVHRDLTRGGHLVANIRRFTGVGFRQLDQLVETGTLDAHSAAVLRALVAAQRSIVVAGAPGSGKTTLLSCLCAELDPSLRVVVAEEVIEADIPVPNVAGLQTRPARGERDRVDLRRLVSGFLRMAPDVAIVGEVRDREALPLLLTLSSGVTGYTTIHAASARRALTRLRFVAQLDPAAAQLSVAALNHLVADSIDVVVHLRRLDGRPRVTEILAVEDLAAGDAASTFTATELFHRPAPDAPLSWTGQVPVRLSRLAGEYGVDLGDVLRAGS
ncbi:MAG: ATPase, T2SS/T4P/T4SS family [Actinomycetota bacterium]